MLPLFTLVLSSTSWPATGESLPEYTGLGLGRTGVHLKPRLPVCCYQGCRACLVFGVSAFSCPLQFPTMGYRDGGIVCFLLAMHHLCAFSYPFGVLPPLSRFPMFFHSSRHGLSFTTLTLLIHGVIQEISSLSSLPGVTTVTTFCFSQMNAY